MEVYSYIPRDHLRQSADSSYLIGGNYSQVDILSPPLQCAAPAWWPRRLTGREEQTLPAWFQCGVGFYTFVLSRELGIWRYFGDLSVWARDLWLRPTLHEPRTIQTHSSLAGARTARNHPPKSVLLATTDRASRGSDTVRSLDDVRSLRANRRTAACAHCWARPGPGEPHWAPSPASRHGRLLTMVVCRTLQSPTDTRCSCPRYNARLVSGFTAAKIRSWRADLFPPSIRLPAFQHHFSTTHICQVGTFFTLHVAYGRHFNACSLGPSLGTMIVSHACFSHTADAVRPKTDLSAPKCPAFPGLGLTLLIQ